MLPSGAFTINPKHNIGAARQYRHPSLASPIPWPLQSFYINRFFTLKGLHLQSDSEIEDDLEKPTKNSKFSLGICL